MNLTVINRDPGAGRRLLLIWAGWGMDARPFEHLAAPGYDIAVVWDYTDESLDPTPLEGYREIVVMAWSMGVYEASMLLGRYNLPVTLTVAVNGTMRPVDDERGIPTAIFDGTLDTLSDNTLARFNRRMCGSAPALELFNGRRPQRDIDSLRGELAAIGRRARSEEASFGWDAAVIGTRDMIFPAAAQRRAWQGVATVEIDDPHLPDFQRIIERFLVNKPKVAARFEAARADYDNEASLQRRAGERLVAQLLSILPAGSRVDRAVEIGAGSGRLAMIYASALDIKELELWDIAPIALQPDVEGVTVVIDDAETRLKSLDDDSIDLIISSSTLQWFNSPVGGVREIERVLRPGGIAAIALYVNGTYRSCRDLLGGGLNYASADAIIGALSKSTIRFSLITDEEVTFESTRSLLEHIRHTGVNATADVATGTLRAVMADNSLRTLEYKTLYLIFRKL